MSSIRYHLPTAVNDRVMYWIGYANCCFQYYYDNTFSASEITDNIFVGDLASASNNVELKKHGISHVLGIMNGIYPYYTDEFEYKIIHINDDPWVDITKFFDESNEFIDRALSDPQNKIMIHCQQGKSRSITLLLAYKLYKINEASKIPLSDIDATIADVLTDVKSLRSVAEPNEGFIEALRKFIKRLNGYNDTNTMNLNKDTATEEHVPLT